MLLGQLFLITVIVLITGIDSRYHRGDGYNPPPPPPYPFPQQLPAQLGGGGGEFHS